MGGLHRVKRLRMSESLFVHGLVGLIGDLSLYPCTQGSNIFFVVVVVLTSLLEYNCFTMLCWFLLCNKVNQLYVYIYPYIPSVLHLPPTVPIPPLEVVTKHPADLPVLYSCFPLVIYFTFGSVDMSMLFSHFIPAYPSHSPCQVHSLHLHLYSCPASRFIRTTCF